MINVVNRGWGAREELVAVKEDEVVLINENKEESEFNETEISDSNRDIFRNTLQFEVLQDPISDHILAKLCLIDQKWNIGRFLVQITNHRFWWRLARSV